MTTLRLRDPGFLAAMAVAATAWLAAPTVSRASPINYVFSPDASATVSGITEAISGSFTFDTASNTESNVTITLSDAFHTATYAALSLARPNSSDIAAESAQPLFSFIEIIFAAALSSSPDPISHLLFTEGIDGPVVAEGTMVLGTAIFATATVPAPVIGHGLSVLLAVGSVLFGCKLFERGKRRRLQFG
jgi:hypothetical protein